MKILCKGCGSAFRMVALRGNKDKFNKNESKLVTSCMVCSDQISHTLHDVPKTQRDRDTIRLRVIDQRLWRTATRDCVRGQKDELEYLKCDECPHAGAIDKDFCELGKERYGLLLMRYPEDDEPEELDATAGEEEDFAGEYGG